MKPNLSDNVISHIEDHARRYYPNEICGLVVNNNQYVEMENMAEDKTKYFKFDKNTYADYMASGQVTHIVHSHIGQDYPSQYDMQQQIRTGLPWIICNISPGRRPSTFMWGHPTERAPLLGREFRHGTADCYELVRDFYKKAAGIDLPALAREFEWWYKKDADTEQPLNILMRHMEEFGFTRITESEMRPFDCMFAQIYSKVPNHCGAYVGNDLVLHHMYSRASRREPYSRIRSRVVVWLRYTKGELPREVSEAIW